MWIVLLAMTMHIVSQLCHRGGCRREGVAYLPKGPLDAIRSRILATRAFPPGLILKLHGYITVDDSTRV